MRGLLKTLTELMRGKPLLCRHVYLRPPARGDWRAWAALREESRAYLEPWEPSWSTDTLSRRAFMRRLRIYGMNSQADRGYAFFIFLRGADQLVGGLSLNQVHRGIGQAANVGYWIGERFAGRGLMTDALAGALPFAFEGLRLHRVSAAVLKHNTASRRVLEKVGFTEEGMARQYLRINGKWQDHVLYGMLSTDARPMTVETAAPHARRRRPRRFALAAGRALDLKSGS